MEDNNTARKRGLGMGLSALLGSDEALRDGPSRSSPQHVPVAFLRPSLLQPRRHFDEDELKAMAESIRQKGILQPLVVRRSSDDDDGYEIIAGERRWRAAQLAGLHELPISLQELSDADVLEIALIENLQREDLSAIEEAEAYHKLMDEYGHTQEKMAGIVGKSRSHIANTLRLLKLPPQVRDMVLSGKLSAGHARALLGVDEPAGLAQSVIDRGLSVRELEAIISAGRGVVSANTRKPPPEKDPDVLACERQLSNRLGLDVNIKPRRKGGAVTIRYSSGDQLDSLLQRLLSTS